MADRDPQKFLDICHARNENYQKAILAPTTSLSIDESFPSFLQNAVIRHHVGFGGQHARNQAGIKELVIIPDDDSFGQCLL